MVYIAGNTDKLYWKKMLRYTNRTFQKKDNKYKPIYLTTCASS